MSTVVPPQPSADLCGLVPSLMQAGDLATFVHGKLAFWHRGLRGLKVVNNLNLPTSLRRLFNQPGVALQN